MPTVSVDIDDDWNIILLRGDVHSVRSNTGLWMFLKDFLKAKFNAECIEIPYTSEDKEQTFAKVRKALSKFGFDENLSCKATGEFERMIAEEQMFQDFSKRALEIRNNSCDKSEFSAFAEAIYTYMPNRKLYPLQLLSAYHLAFSLNQCNFSVPGSGKTSIVYAAYAYFRSLPREDRKHVDKLLIVGPLNSFGPWELEYRECFGRRPDSKRLHGAVPRGERASALMYVNTPEIILIPYQGVPTLRKELIHFLDKNRAMVVLDEAHKIKNVDDGVIASNTLELAKHASSRVVLTGTPIPNGYKDLVNLFKFIWPHRDILGYKVNHLQQMTDHPNDSRISKLIDNMSPYFIRIRKTDLGLPPPREYPPIIVPMGQVQRRIYDHIENKYLSKIDSDGQPQIVRDMVRKAKMIRLMQAATNPRMLSAPLEKYFEEEIIPSGVIGLDLDIMRDVMRYEQLEVPSKFVSVRSLVEELIKNGEKVVIWTSFIANIQDLGKYLLSNGIESRAIYGDVPVDTDEGEDEAETRESIVRQFHEPDSTFKVIIANPHAVSESISLHKACHNAIYLDRTFNAGHFIQSKDRIHRYGLKADDLISYYYLIAEHSIDGVIHNRLALKEQRMNDIIEHSPIPLFSNVDNKNVVDDDIVAIIEDYLRRQRGRLNEGNEC